MTTTSTEWTDKIWNPVAGCTVITERFSNFYAMRMASRLEAMGVGKYFGTTRKSGKRAVWTGKVTLDHDGLDAPRRWHKRRKVFVNSMSDLFHGGIRTAFIQQVFAVMRETPQHTYQILTKRADRLLDLSPQIDWPANVWMGVSVENEAVAWRIDRLRETGAAVKFLSCEPMLGSLAAMNLTGIDWVIAGGESGPGSRAMEDSWVREIRDICIATDTAFHFKQWGGVQKKLHRRELDGRTWDEWPIAA